MAHPNNSSHQLHHTHHQQILQQQHQHIPPHQFQPHQLHQLHLAAAAAAAAAVAASAAPGTSDAPASTSMLGAFAHPQHLSYLHASSPLHLLSPPQPMQISFDHIARHQQQSTSATPALSPVVQRPNPSGDTTRLSLTSISSSTSSPPAAASAAAIATKMGSRRIFSPNFKLQVLESYRLDADCKGNQRATARKYGIHRRQIQKWLQCEPVLRTTAADQQHQQQQQTPAAAMGRKLSACDVAQQTGNGTGDSAADHGRQPGINNGRKATINHSHNNNTSNNNKIHHQQHQPIALATSTISTSSITGCPSSLTAPPSPQSSPLSTKSSPPCSPSSMRSPAHSYAEHATPVALEPARSMSNDSAVAAANTDATTSTSLLGCAANNNNNHSHGRASASVTAERATATAAYSSPFYAAGAAAREYAISAAHAAAAHDRLQQLLHPLSAVSAAAAILFDPSSYGQQPQQQTHSSDIIVPTSRPQNDIAPLHYLGKSSSSSSSSVAVAHQHNDELYHAHAYQQHQHEHHVRQQLEHELRMQQQHQHEHYQQRLYAINHTGVDSTAAVAAATTTTTTTTTSAAAATEIPTAAIDLTVRTAAAPRSFNYRVPLKRFWESNDDTDAVSTSAATNTSHSSSNASIASTSSSTCCAVDLSATASAVGQKRSSNMMLDAQASPPKAIKLFKPYLLTDDEESCAADSSELVPTAAPVFAVTNVASPLSDPIIWSSYSSNLSAMPSPSSSPTHIKEEQPEQKHSSDVAFFPCVSVSPALSATDSQISLSADSHTTISSSSMPTTVIVAAASSSSSCCDEATGLQPLRVRTGYGSPVSGYDSATSSSRLSDLIDMAAEPTAATEEERAAMEPTSTDGPDVRCNVQLLAAERSGQVHRWLMQDQHNAQVVD